MKKIVPVIIAAIKQGNKFLMTRRVHLDPEDKESYHDAWQLPGGGMEFGESPEQTLHREIKEEVGVDVEIIRLLPKVYTRVIRNWQGIFIIYLCRLKNPRAKITLDSEASDYNWYSVIEARKLKTVDGTMAIMKDAFLLTAF